MKKNLLLNQSIKILNEREKEIIEDRKLSENPKTLDELSKKYNISRERIRQIETKAFEKLQKAILNSVKSKNLLPQQNNLKGFSIRIVSFSFRRVEILDIFASINFLNL